MHRLCLFVLCVFLCDAVSAADTVSFPGLGGQVKRRPWFRRRQIVLSGKVCWVEQRLEVFRTVQVQQERIILIIQI